MQRLCITCVQSTTDLLCTRALFAHRNWITQRKSLFFIFIFNNNKKFGIVLLPRCFSVSAVSQRNMTWATWWAISANTNESPSINFLALSLQLNAEFFSIWCCNLCNRVAHSVCDICGCQCDGKENDNVDFLLYSWIAHKKTKN